MRMHRFKLVGKRLEQSEANNGHHVIDDKHVFVNGVMEVPAKDGKFRKRILVDFYACECEVFESDEVSATDETEEED